MKLVIVIACCFAVVLAAPAPDHEEDQQQQLRRRLQGLRLRFADADSYAKLEQKNDRYHDRDDVLIRKIGQRGSLKVSYNPTVQNYPRSYPQSYHDLGSLSFRYYAPSSAYQSNSDRLQSNAEKAKYDADSHQGYYQNYYLGSFLREQDQDREEDDDQE